MTCFVDKIDYIPSLPATSLFTAWQLFAQRTLEKKMSNTFIYTVQSTSHNRTKPNNFTVWIQRKQAVDCK